MNVTNQALRRYGSPRLSDLDGVRDNNLDFMRFVAASAVIYAHAYNLQNTPDPFSNFLGIGTGHLAVAIFFCISGFLISGSLVNRAKLVDFTIARILRIYPALIVVNIIVVITAGIFFTTLPIGEYFSSMQTAKYFIINSTLLNVEFELPGVFMDNAFPGAVNGSLWTLPVEMRMYVLVFVAGCIAIIARVFGKEEGKTRLWALGILFVLAFAAAAGAWHAIGLPVFWPVTKGTLDLTTYFAAGVFLFLVRRYLPVNVGILTFCLLVLFLVRDIPLWSVCWPLCLAYICIWFGYTDRIRFHGFARNGDLSYGIYIFAFPIQQSLYSLDPGMHPLWNFGITFVCVLVLAYCSWHLIEKRAMALKKPISQRIDTMVTHRFRRAPFLK